MSIITALFSVLISILALCVSVFTFLWARDARRRKLVDAAYWHIKFTQENMEKWRKIIDDLPDMMRADPEYTPFIVVPREDNLAYTDIIELIRWLKAEKQEETVLRYFHAQANLHATAESFGKEVVRKLPLEQKIRNGRLTNQTKPGIPGPWEFNTNISSRTGRPPLDFSNDERNTGAGNA